MKLPTSISYYGCLRQPGNKVRGIYTSYVWLCARSVWHQLLSITIFWLLRTLVESLGISCVGVDASLPLHLCFPLSYPFPTHKLPSPKNISSSRIEKDRSPHYITFHFSAWIIFNKNTKALYYFVCSSVQFVCSGVLQPSQWPSQLHCNQVKSCPRRKGEEKERQDTCRW